MAELITLLGLGLAAPGLLDILNKAGRAIESRTSEARHLEEDLAKYRSFGTSLARSQLYTQLELLMDIDRNGLIRDELKVQLEDCFKGIISSLIAAENELTAAESHPSKSRIKIMFGRKVAFQSKIQELERHQNAFSSLANLVHQHRSVSPSSLLQNFKIVHETPDDSALRLMKNSDIHVGRSETDGQRLISVLVEHRPYVASYQEDVEQDVAILTIKLQRARLGQSVPPCLGYRKSPFADGFDVVFELPADPDQQCLAHMILSEPRIALDHRIALCKLLARAVSDVHGIGLVHKQIRPHAILVVGKYDNLKPIQALYLTDWRYARGRDRASTWHGGDEWQRAIYQHPSRQGRQVEQRYTIAHDTYSLGVCMLEILLWEAFVVDVKNSNGSNERRIADHFQARAIALGEEHGAPERYLGDTGRMTAKPRVVRNVMLDLCRTELPALVGSKLTEIVERCLCCLNERPETDQERGSDVEDLQSGLDYIGDVIVALDGISI